MSTLYFTARLNGYRLINDLKIERGRGYYRQETIIAARKVAEAYGNPENYKLRKVTDLGRRMQEKYLKEAENIGVGIDHRLRNQHSVKSKQELIDNLAEMAKTSNQLGSACYNSEGLKEAQERYEEALKINENLRSAGHVNDIEWAEIQNNLGSICHAKGNSLKKEGYHQKAKEMFDQALERYKQALSVFEKASTNVKTGTDVKVKVGRVFHHLGNVYRDLNNLPKAKESFVKALEGVCKLKN
ncbi:tetratricopeptide repeat protein [Wolbachia endosymbiont of Ctenocephalides felis wCfeT]|uniref:tetratricopeptide repeat protein n=1 Tax=Wolbachia endosymbiont of Ctenocephalides felis wCfeT TaxID=2732593 RepID=UPI00144870F6|nr:tetratricopeptide repeat protein [Wolbachia endosymbiont of Ctenocephalides felis wCfeT]